MSQSSHHHNRAKTGEDYCSYVTKMEKTTSMCEGPHFPNINMMFIHKEEFMNKEEEEEAVYRGSTGRFGRAEHIEQFKDKVNYKATAGRDKRRGGRTFKAV